MTNPISSKTKQFVFKGARLRTGSSWTEAIVGLFGIAFTFATPFFGSHRRRWGATDEEIATSHPGDELVLDPNWTATHAIIIEANPRQVWPWIAQIGQGRGGFYSYEKLENIAGCQIKNVSRILGEHQHIREGDLIKLHAEVPPMKVAMVDEPSALVLYGSPVEGAQLSNTWAFLLCEQPDGSTRLISRTRYRHGHSLRSKLMGGPLFIEPLSFVMEKKMLKVIKALTESESKATLET